MGEKIQVFLERLEDRNGNVVVSASKARQIKGWEMLLDCYEKNEPIIGKFISKTKGGAIVEHIDTGFNVCPWRQFHRNQLKTFQHFLMNH